MLAILLANLGSAASSPISWASNVEQGRELAARLCAKCHLNEGQAEKRSASEIPGFAAVANRQDQTIEHIVAWLQSAPPMMPNHHLSQDEIEALAAFIMSLRAP
jgi:mono/diheme cytochrome c family protein